MFFRWTIDAHCVVSLGLPRGIRTPGLLLRRQLLFHWAMGSSFLAPPPGIEPGTHWLTKVSCVRGHLMSVSCYYLWAKAELILERRAGFEPAVGRVCSALRWTKLRHLRITNKLYHKTILVSILKQRIILQWRLAYMYYMSMWTLVLLIQGFKNFGAEFENRTQDAPVPREHVTTSTNSA